MCLRCLETSPARPSPEMMNPVAWYAHRRLRSSLSRLESKKHRGPGLHFPASICLNASAASRCTSGTEWWVNRVSTGIASTAPAQVGQEFEPRFNEVNHSRCVGLISTGKRLLYRGKSVIDCPERLPRETSRFRTAPAKGSREDRNCVEMARFFIAVRRASTTARFDGSIFSRADPASATLMGSDRSWPRQRQELPLPAAGPIAPSTRRAHGRVCSAFRKVIMSGIAAPPRPPSRQAIERLPCVRIVRSSSHRQEREGIRRGCSNSAQGFNCLLHGTGELSFVPVMNR